MSALCQKQTFTGFIRSVGDGELWINERKLVPGDYNYGAPGSDDHRVWSETGCTCVLVTSTEDVLQSVGRVSC
jgi:hypothetical protein